MSRWCLAVSHGLPSVLHGRVSPSLGHQKAALGSFFAVRFWLVWARVSVVFGCFAWAAERLVFGLEVRFARSSFIFL